MIFVLSWYYTIIYPYTITHTLLFVLPVDLSLQPFSNCTRRIVRFGCHLFEIGARETGSTRRRSVVFGVTTMKDQRTTEQRRIDRGHPGIDEPLRAITGGSQFSEFPGLVPDFATGLIVGLTRRVRIVRFDDTRPRGRLGRRP